MRACGIHSALVRQASEVRLDPGGAGRTHADCIHWCPALENILQKHIKILCHLQSLLVRDSVEMDPLPILVQHSLDEKASNQTMPMAHLAQHISVSKHASFASARPTAAIFFLRWNNLGCHGTQQAIHDSWWDSDRSTPRAHFGSFGVIEILLIGDVWVWFISRVDGAWRLVSLVAWVHLVCN